MSWLRLWSTVPGVPRVAKGGLMESELKRVGRWLSVSDLHGVLHIHWEYLSADQSGNEKVWKWVPRSIAFTSAYLNGCSDFISRPSKPLMASLFQNILVDLLRIFMSGSRGLDGLPEVYKVGTHIQVYRVIARLTLAWNWDTSKTYRLTEIHIQYTYMGWSIGV